MRKILVLIFVFILSVATADVCLAKNKGLDKNNPSVQTLMQVVNEGKEFRKNDAPMKKADVEADRAVVRELKREYLEENKMLLEIGKE